MVHSFFLTSSLKKTLWRRCIRLPFASWAGNACAPVIIWAIFLLAYTSWLVRSLLLSNVWTSNHEKSIIEKYIYMKIMKPASMRVEAGFVVDWSKFRWRMKLTTFLCSFVFFYAPWKRYSFWIFSVSRVKSSSTNSSATSMAWFRTSSEKCCKRSWAFIGLSL